MARELYKLRDKIKEIKTYCERAQSDNLAYLEKDIPDSYTYDYYEAKIEITTEILKLLEIHKRWLKILNWV